uniref:Clathrin/coatomer adaptor adaptin-like N-terminal domain-containing protein n=1 Tax=Romanomermis culicivorax TaxID=13658 RepID=A0A915I094_ROMCU
MFEPYLKSFFVRSSDPTHIKLLKLEILTNLATQSNISMILREFQTYVATQDKEFAAATIDAIGRCACNIKEVTDVCLSGLVNLLANKNETVVAQSVVVIKKLLQSQPSEHKDIIKQMAKLIDSVKISAARASIVWLIGEYCERVPKIAPDVLRKMAITFGHEDEYVKLQILNLAVKLYLTNKAQSEKLVQYVFQLAKYDLSYDLRDRARFLRNLVLLDEKNQSSNRFAYSTKSIFINQKPAPVVESSFKDRDQFQLGTLSHYLNQRCCEYKEIPEFPEVAPDPSVRQVAKDYSRRPKSRSRPRGGDAISPVGVSSPLAKSQEKEEVKVVKRKEKFYSDEESEKESEEEDDDENDENSDEDEEEEEDEDDEEEQSESEDDDDDEEENEEEIEEKKEENHVIGGKSIRSTVQNTTSHVQEQKAMSREHSKNVEKRSDIDNLLLDLNFDYSAPSALIMQPTADIDSHSTHKRTFPRKSNYAAEVLVP